MRLATVQTIVVVQLKDGTDDATYPAAKAVPALGPNGNAVTWYETKQIELQAIHLNYLVTESLLGCLISVIASSSVVSGGGSLLSSGAIYNGPTTILVQA